MADVNVVRAKPVHFRVHQRYQMVTGLSQDREVLIVDGVLDDKVAFVLELLAVLSGNHGALTRSCRPMLLAMDFDMEIERPSHRVGCFVRLSVYPNKSTEPI